jgi:hypothetical protein
MEATFETELTELIAKWRELGTREWTLLEALEDAIGDIDSFPQF